MVSNKKLKLAELGRISEEEFKSVQKIPVIVFLDNIRSMHNVGSFFRTGDAFRIEKIFLSGLTAQPPHRDIEKTALGATATVEWEYTSDAMVKLQEFKTEGYQIISVEQTERSVMIQDFQPDSSSKYVVVVGNEVKGVQQKIIDISDLSLEIPQEGTKHSLNVSVCGGIVLWHFFSALS